MERTGNSAAACIYGYWDGLPIHAYQLFYRPGVAAGFFPTNDGQVCVFAATSRQRFRSESRSGVAQLYAALLVAAAPGALDPGTGAQALRG